MEIKKLVLGPLRTNCYIVINNGECVVIDSATCSNQILEFCKENNLAIKAVLLTHGHFDHCMACRELQKNNIDIYASEFDANIIENRPFEFGLKPNFCFKANKIVKDGEILNLIGLKFEVIQTSGHTEGSVCYKLENHLFAGDTLFSGGGYGRCDLYSGSFEKIQDSIKNKLFKLPGDTIVYSGHGNESTIKEAKELIFF